MKRDSIIFYRSFYEAINSLPSDVQAMVYSAIFEYSLNFNEVVLEGLPKAIFTLIKPQLDANNKRWENGSKGGRNKAKLNQNETKTEPKVLQEKPKTEANNNVNDNVNDNVIKKKISKREKSLKISFEESKFFEKKEFALAFKNWPKSKLSYYYDSAVRYSNEGNKYVNWDAAIAQWAKKDEINGKIKFPEEINTNKTAAPPEIKLG